MFLYNLTLQRATGITHAVHGNFSGTKQQEIAVSRGKILELLRPDANTGKVHTLLTVEIFGVIRSMMAFRLTGGSKVKLVKAKITWELSKLGRLSVLGSSTGKNTEMFLYNLTLQRATGITHAVHGNFSGTKQQEIAVSRGKILELLRPDANTGKVHTLLTVEIFGVIRSMMAFRLTGGSKGE
ncbi:splicing factor 3B subunit 3-like [Centruroides sculpturatus]|uniref:splicing factor 3B subunit 3-like n=1 Tax=Centruroides sculpturatus TaxID=218467 RepID=UPI000C6E059E|nr:splicing factor 3B subunit 3-like [Centruroides sculpturatus]